MIRSLKKDAENDVSRIDDQPGDEKGQCEACKGDVTTEFCPSTAFGFGSIIEHLKNNKKRGVIRGRGHEKKVV